MTNRHISDILPNVLHDLQLPEDRGSSIATAMHDARLTGRAPLSPLNREESEEDYARA